MRVQIINGYNSVCSINRVNKKVIKDNTTFKSYNEAVKKIAGENIKTEAKAAEAFAFLINELLNESEKTTNLDWKMVKPYILGGMRTFLEEITKPIAQVKSELRNLIFDSKLDELPLIKKEGKPALSLFNWGKQGFWNSIFESESAKNDVRIDFFAPDASVNLGLEKNGALYLEQNVKGEKTQIRTFHTNGNVKSVTTQYSEAGMPTTEYFNKDGSSDLLNNFLYGGTATNVTGMY